MYYAQAVVLNKKVYVGGGYTAGDVTTAGNIYTYDPTTDTWKTLQSPTRYSALTTYHNKLLVVGGEEASTGQVTNQLWVFEEGEQTWTQSLPPMPTRRKDTSAVSYQDYLIVAGGYNYTDGPLNTVEVFDGQQWGTADPLPERCCSMKSTSHNGHYYLMGGDCQGTSVFYTSVWSFVERATQHLPPHPATLTSPQSGRHSQIPHTSHPALPYLKGHWWLLAAATTNLPYTSTSLSPSHGYQLGRCPWEWTAPALSHCPLER